MSRTNLLKLTPVVSIAVLCVGMSGSLRAEDKLDKKVTCVESEDVREIRKGYDAAGIGQSISQRQRRPSI